MVFAKFTSRDKMFTKQEKKRAKVQNFFRTTKFLKEKYNKSTHFAKKYILFKH